MSIEIEWRRAAIEVQERQAAALEAINENLMALCRRVEDMDTNMCGSAHNLGAILMQLRS